MSTTINKKSERAAINKKADPTFSDFEENIIVKKTFRAAEVFKKYPLPSKSPARSN
jgi:hypothetical protein